MLKRRWTALLLPLALFAPVFAGANRAAAQNDITGHVVAGYQGWFAAKGDGSPVGSLTSGNYHQNLETYPDLREFSSAEQFVAQSPYAFNNFPNGNTAAVFSSDRDFTAALHVSWMKQYGIDVAAVQRFGEVATDPVYAQQKNQVTTRIRNACQSSGLKFYIEYDTSGSATGGWGSNWITSIENDWTTFAVNQGMVSSSAYARQGGKPVVELWGMGLNGNNTVADASQWLTLINWFKSQGVYVIGGVPTGWAGNGGYTDGRSGFSGVYAACNAINPWVVGRFSGTAGADNYANNALRPDFTWCQQHGIDYLPCVYPGTSFFNSNGSTKNVIPRLHGDLLWEQFANLRSAGISCCFVSMFDEFNEATAIAKSAEDATMIPANQWFLTLDADGQSVSSDFYLRLTQDGGKMIKGQIPLQWTHPTPFWNNLFSTGFESGQTQPTWSDSPDSAYNASPRNVSGYTSGISPECGERTNEQKQSGTVSLMYSGTANGGTSTYCYYRVFDYSGSPITIDANTILYYWIYPQNDNGRYVAVDFHFTDGTTLRDSGCVDQNGKALHPAAGHGGSIPLNAWSVVTSKLGALAGKRIDKVWVAFDRAGATGQYRGYIDDIRLSH